MTDRPDLRDVAQESAARPPGRTEGSSPPPDPPPPDSLRYDDVVARRSDAALYAVRGGAPVALPSAAGASIPDWAPSTAYKANDVVRAPDGTLQRAKSNFTSGTSFSATSWLPLSAGSGSPSQPVSLRTLPWLANGVWGYNGAAFIQDNVWTTSDGTQYVAYVASSLRPYIAKLPADGSEPTVFDLGTLVGNPLATPVAADGHNIVSLGVDSTGRVHVAGNMHNNALRYVVSGANGDISTWTTGAMVGTLETSVAYPSFVALNDGTLVFFYRDGTSGSGDLILNRLNAGTQTWARVAKVIDGKTAVENAYPHHYAVAPNGDLHVAFEWRASGSADTTNDICHIKSADGGTTWTSVSGAALTLPVTHATAPLVVDTAASGSGLLNTGGLDVDQQGRPHLAYLRYDQYGYTQVFHTYWDGSAWQTEQLTALTKRQDLTLSVVQMDPSRPALVCSTTGRVLVIYRTSTDAKRGTIRCIDCTPGSTHREFPLAVLETNQWEPTFDTRAARTMNLLRMLVSPCMIGDASTGSHGTLPEENPQQTGAQAVAAWSGMWAGVLTVDMARIDEVASDRAPRPRLVPFASGALPSGTAPTFAATTITDTSLPSLVLDRLRPDRIVLARLRCRARVTGAATGTITLSALRTADGTVIDLPGPITVTSQTTAQFETPWIPVPNFGGDWTQGGVLKVRSTVTANALEISAASLELAELVLETGTAARRRKALPAANALTGIPGLALLLDPEGRPGSDVNGAQMTTVVDDADISGNGNSVTQSNGANKPTLLLPWLNSKRAYRFSSVGPSKAAFSGTPFGLPTGPFTYVGAFALQAVGVIQTLLIIGADPNGRNIRVNASNVMEFLKAGVASIGASNTALASGVPHVVSLTYDGTNYAWRLDGTADGSGASAQTFSEGALLMGYRGSANAGAGGEYATADFGRQAVFSRVLATSELQAAERYLGTYYGITVA